MSGFYTTLLLEDEGGMPYTLAKLLLYRSALLKRWIKVPAGFKTDLASIPRPLWAILPKSGKYDKAAVVHDYLYAVNGVTREEADQVLREAMEALGVGRVTRWLIYRAVRLGGRFPWKRYRDAEARARRAGADGASPVGR